MNCPPRANLVQDTARPPPVFKGHHETSSAQLAILPRSRSQLACYLYYSKALPSKVTLSVEQRVWGAKSHLPLPCRLVTSDFHLKAKNILERMKDWNLKANILEGRHQ